MTVKGPSAPADTTTRTRGGLKQPLAHTSYSFSPGSSPCIIQILIAASFRGQRPVGEPEGFALAAVRLGRLRGRSPSVRAVGVQAARLHVVAQVRVEQNVLQVLPKLLVFHGRERLDPAVEVAVYPVGAADVDLLLARVLEVEDAAVFEEAADDAADAYVLRQAGDARPQHAHAADDEVNRDAGLRRQLVGEH